MYGLLELSHRYAFQNNRDASRLVMGGREQQVKEVSSEVTRALHQSVSNSKFTSIESYSRFIATWPVERISRAVSAKLGQDIEISRLFDTTFLWKTVETKEVDVERLIHFTNNRIRIFGDIYKSIGAKIRNLDEKNGNLQDFTETARDAFAAHDIIIWQLEPSKKILEPVAHTIEDEDFSGDAFLSDGIVGEAIENKRTVYYPNIRDFFPKKKEEDDWRDIVQFPELMLSRGWRGMLLCPLHYRTELVGVLGIYSTDSMVFSKNETSILLYLLANLSKRLERQIAKEIVESEFSTEQMMLLAPALYVGTQTSYRLHSIKNRIGHATEVVKNSIPHLPETIKKDGETVKIREKARNAQEECSSIVEELESCLTLGADNRTELFKEVKVADLVTSTRELVGDIVSTTHIKRYVSWSYRSDATIVADKVALEQAVYNLVDNAFYFLENDFLLDRDPAIVVQVKQVGRQFQIFVEDNANGMNEHDKASARKIYFSGKRKNGSGLGLWMTDRIVREHRGRFELQTGVGGTVALLWLPTKKTAIGSRLVEGETDI